MTIPTMANTIDGPKKFWAISAFNSTPYYVWGTYWQAEEFANRINERDRRSINAFYATGLTEEQVKELHIDRWSDVVDLTTSTP